MFVWLGRRRTTEGKREEHRSKEAVQHIAAALASTPHVPIPDVLPPLRDWQRGGEDAHSWSWVEPLVDGERDLVDDDELAAWDHHWRDRE